MYGRGPKSTHGGTAHAHRVTVTKVTVLATNGLSRDQIGGTTVAIEVANTRTPPVCIVQHGLSPTFQVIAPDPANLTATQ